MAVSRVAPSARTSRPAGTNCAPGVTSEQHAKPAPQRPVLCALAGAVSRFKVVPYNKHYNANVDRNTRVCPSRVRRVKNALCLIARNALFDVERVSHVCATLIELVTRCEIKAKSPRRLAANVVSTGHSTG